MDCLTAQNLMLEVDLDELQGHAATDLSRHLASCDRCRVAASRIVDGERAMAAALGAIAPLQAHSPVPLRAIAGARRGRWRRWIPALPVAAAAAGLMFVLLGGDTPELHAPSTQITRASPAVRLAEQNGNVVMLETDNPKITVLWFY